MHVWGLHFNSPSSFFRTGHREEVFHKRPKSGEPGLLEKTWWLLCPKGILPEECISGEAVNCTLTQPIFSTLSADDWFHRQKTFQLQKLALWLTAVVEGGWPYCAWVLKPTGNHRTHSSTFSTSHKHHSFSNLKAIFPCTFVNSCCFREIIVKKVISYLF